MKHDIKINKRKLGISIISTLLFSAPALFAWWRKGSKVIFLYKVFEAYDQSAWWCFFTQLSMLLAFLSLSYFLAEGLSAAIPQIGLRLATRRQTIQHWENWLQVRSYVRKLVFFLLALWVLSQFAYNSTLLDSAFERINARLQPGSKGQASDISFITFKSASTVFIFERLWICGCIFLFVITLGKYFVVGIRATFHDTTFGSRIEQANTDLLAVGNLYKKAVATRTEVRFVYGLSSELRELKSLDFSSREKATVIAKAIFSALQIDSKMEVPSDMNVLFGNTDRINEDECINALTALFDRREYIRRSLISNKTIITKLDGIIQTICWTISGLLCTPFMDIGVSVLWSGFIALFTAFGFCLQSVGKTCFDAMIFIFVVHAFDIGDDVNIEGELMRVDNILVFTTTFKKPDSTLIYAPNASLCNKYIGNISRSRQQ